MRGRATAAPSSARADLLQRIFHGHEPGAIVATAVTPERAHRPHQIAGDTRGFCIIKPAKLLECARPPRGIRSEHDVTAILS
jgi:hypothetical protein